MTHSPTVLITGCSSGFGLETAQFFLDKGWNVIATMPGTAFGDNARRLMADPIPDAYVAFRDQVFKSVRDTASPMTHALDVAEAVWQAVTDPSAPMRTPAGADAVAVSAAVSKA